MGKKNKKGKSGVAEAEVGMPRHLRREILAIANELLEKCSLPFGSQSTEWNDFLDVYKIVEKLRKKQQNYVLQHSNREENVKGFVDWLHANDVSTDAVTIADCGTSGFGLKASKDIQENELFLSMPRKLMLTTQTAKNSILGPLMAEDRILQSMPNVAMGLHVLCEYSQPESFWQPYLKFLPKSYSTPLYFSPDEIQLLKSSPALGDILSQFRNITRQYAYFFRLFQGHPEASKLPIKNFCFDDYRWAVSTVMTRQNQIPSSGNEMDTALIPLWDMCNHTNGLITTDFNCDLDRSECFSLKDFKKDDEVLIFYGPRSNTEFLLHSGFVYEENEFDQLAVRMGVSKNDMLYSMKAEVLARLSLSSNRTFYLGSNSLNPVDSDLLAYLRVFSMDHDTLFEHMFGEGAATRLQQLKDFSKPVCKENELKAWSYLETRALILLKAYPTTIQEDGELLSKEGLSENSRLAVKLRRCEKKILESVMEYCRLQKKTVQEKFEDNDGSLATSVTKTRAEHRGCLCPHSDEGHRHEPLQTRVQDETSTATEDKETKSSDELAVSFVDVNGNDGLGNGELGNLALVSNGIEQANNCSTDIQPLGSDGSSIPACDGEGVGGLQESKDQAVESACPAADCDHLAKELVSLSTEEHKTDDGTG